MLETIWQDLTHGARMLHKNPGFTLIAVLSIAIGVGANAAMFSVADGLVLRPLPVSDPGRVVIVAAESPNTGFRNRSLSYPDYIDVRDHARSFDGVVAYRFVITSFATRADEAVQRNVGMAVSANFFDAMRIRPALGRPFRADEDSVVGRDAVVILDYDDWAQRFNADPGIVDRRIRIGGVEFTVIGVGPKGFTGIDHDVHPAFYVPLAMFTTIQSGAQPFETMRNRRELTVKARLKPGIGIDQARREVQSIAANLERSYPDTNQHQGLTLQTELDAIREQRADTSLVFMLMTLAVAVLIVACANVAGLLTSQAPVRAREIAMRVAVGAAHGRVVRQLVTESILVAGGGCALGLLAASGVIGLFRRLVFPTDIPMKLTFELDGRALAVGLSVAAASVLLSSLLPAWHAARVDVVRTMKASTSDSLSRRSRAWGRSLLVCGQVALSLVLLTVSLFLYRAFHAEFSQGIGFRTDRLLMMTLDPGLARYDEPRSDEFYRQLTERARAVPGVASVALTSTPPLMADSMQFMPIAPEGFQFQRGATNVGVMLARVDESYFDTLAIPIVKGRGFLSTDTRDRPRVAVVNQRLAAHYWPGQDAVGKRIRLDGDGGAFAEIVGVAADVKYFFIVEPPIEFLYLDRQQGAGSQSTLLVATQHDAAAMVSAVRDAIRSLDPNMPVFGVRTMDDFYAARVLRTTNLLVGSVAVMGLVGLMLAMVGLYGLVAYTASRRTREIGVRIALGATPGAVSRMVLSHGFALAMSGTAVGMVGSVATRGLLQSVFIGQARVDAMTYAVVVPALVGITLLAAYIPARRAARVDPLTALRTE